MEQSAGQPGRYYKQLIILYVLDYPAIFAHSRKLRRQNLRWRGGIKCRLRKTRSPCRQTVRIRRPDTQAGYARSKKKMPPEGGIEIRQGRGHVQSLCPGNWPADEGRA